MLARFHHLGVALGFILAFIAVKLFLQRAHQTITRAAPEIPSLVSLAVILVALVVGIIASLRRRPPSAAELLTTGTQLFGRATSATTDLTRRWVAVVQSRRGGDY